MYSVSSDKASVGTAPGCGVLTRARNEATAAEFYSAMASRHWSPSRTTAAFRVLVQREKAKDVGASLGLTKDSVSQASGAAFAIIEGWRLKQFALAAHSDEGVAGIVDDIQRLVARVNALCPAVEVGGLRVALRKSVRSLQDAADELRPHI